MELGRLRIEYRKDDNVIQIYNSPEVCSLVINNKVVDEYKGDIATRFTLKGTIEKDGKVDQIVAQMGAIYMQLLYNGVLVSKKFMAFG